MNDLFSTIPISEDLTNLFIDRNTELYFIVEHTFDEQFISLLANKLLDSSCRIFNFYGKYAGVGEKTFDAVDIKRGYSNEDVALTSSFYEIKDFVKSFAVSMRIEKHNLVVMYDDFHLYNQFIHEVRKNLPWWLRLKIPKLGAENDQ